MRKALHGASRPVRKAHHGASRPVRKTRHGPRQPRYGRHSACDVLPQAHRAVQIHMLDVGAR
ncbi:hypothetical protein, partial [Streptomyces katsurahamanus]|uniref:hypothetical protein n=1 Tax=Streptomyces katsurahamanus TaxID=2577098 RepID=UPI001E3D4643